MEEKKWKSYHYLPAPIERDKKTLLSTELPRKKILVDQQRGRVKEEFVLLYHVTRRFTD